MVKKFEIEWGGRPLKIEIGKLAGQAHGACTVQYGDTVVLATAVMGEPRDGGDFFPLTVDYEERLYAAGMIKTSRFIKREGRSSDEAILSGRMIDRSIRPLFDDRMRHDVQVILTVLSIDGDNDPDIPGLVGASLALMISPIPWRGPIAGIRIGRVDNEWVINPTYSAREKGNLDIVVAGTDKKVLMIEAGAEQIDEEKILEAIKFGSKHLKPVLKLIEEIVDALGLKKLTPEELLGHEDTPEGREAKNLIREKAKNFLLPKIHETVFGTPKGTKASRQETIEKLEQKLEEYLISENTSKELRKVAINYIYSLVEHAITEGILSENKRVDGRALNEIRPLFSEVSIYPRLHGSAIFQRGETQIFSTVTLGAPGVEQTLEGIEFVGKKRYFHHYNFPPYSVGETGPLRGPGRREIGHGALAEKALLPVIPEREEFPYTIRVVSEVFSSNGSSSMGSTCGSTLALMDAGVPLKAPVAGIAMGLASDSAGRSKIITDLQDLEDGKGGMDFKVAGTREGITAIQLDTKTDGLSFDLVHEALEHAREARLKILDTMGQTIPEPRKELSPYAPRIVSFRIDPLRIREVIGPGGKIINEIIDKTGVQIDIEKDGLVSVTSANAEGLEKAVTWIKNIVREFQVGEIIRGKVVRIMDFGAFVELSPGHDGMVHISQLAPFRVGKVTDVVKIGDEVPVKIVEIDEMGRINLSLKAAREELGEPQAEPLDDNGFDDRKNRDKRGPRQGGRF